MKKFWTTVLALALGAALTTSAVAGPPRSHIETAMTTFAAAFNGGDGAGVAALYAEDAAVLPPDGARVDGRDAIQAFWQGAIDGGVRRSRCSPMETWLTKWASSRSRSRGKAVGR
jgi:hypothetical protein